jgi:hypothetical protein
MKITELLQHNLFPNEGYANVEGYDYGRVFNNGSLLKILNSPTETKPASLLLNYNEGLDGYWIQRGNEYLIPLVYLYVALACRVNKHINFPEIVFHPGISVQACSVSEYEARKFINDIKLIYNLHLLLTADFYHRQVSLLSLERCEELMNEIESIEV